MLYRHFPSKGDLVAAYLERFRARRERAAERAVRHLADPAAALVALTAEVADRVGTPGFRGCAVRNYLTEFPDSHDAAGRVAREYLRDSRARLADLVARVDVADPDGVAERIGLVVEGLYAGAARPTETRAPRTAVALVEEILAAAPRQRGCRTKS
jgi:AcrR family transcriptional regulator